MEKALSCGKSQQRLLKIRTRSPCRAACSETEKEAKPHTQASDPLARGTGAGSPEWGHARCSPIAPGSQGVTPHPQQTDPSQGPLPPSCSSLLWGTGVGRFQGRLWPRDHPRLTSQVCAPPTAGFPVSRPHCPRCSVLSLPPKPSSLLPCLVLLPARIPQLTSLLRGPAGPCALRDPPLVFSPRGSWLILALYRPSPPGTLPPTLWCASPPNFTTGAPYPLFFLRDLPLASFSPQTPPHRPQLHLPPPDLPPRPLLPETLSPEHTTGTPSPDSILGVPHPVLSTQGPPAPASLTRAPLPSTSLQRARPPILFAEGPAARPHCSGTPAPSSPRPSPAYSLGGALAGGGRALGDGGVDSERRQHRLPPGQHRGSAGRRRRHL